MKAIAKDKSIEERIRKGKVRTENIVKKTEKRKKKDKEKGKKERKNKDKKNTDGEKRKQCRNETLVLDS